MKAKQLEAQNVPGKEVDTVSDDKNVKNIISKGNQDTLPTTTCHHHLERGPYFFYLIYVQSVIVGNERSEQEQAYYGTTNVRKVIACYDYQAQTDDNRDLSFERGEKLIVSCLCLCLVARK